MKTALIFGVGGQDGSYLADILLAKGYHVFGTHRRSSVDNLVRVRHLLDNAEFTLLRADVTDASSVRAAVTRSEPYEVYHVADQDEVGWSKDMPGYTASVTYGGAAAVLECCREWAAESQDWSLKVFVPSSATIFGDAPAPQTLETSFAPASPYAVAKLGVLYLCRYYRSIGLNVTCGIMYNHDSPRRGGDYVLQKIARGETLTGDWKNVVVDVGYAREYMAEVIRLTAAGANRDVAIRTAKGYTLESLVRYQDDLNNTSYHVSLPDGPRDMSYLPTGAHQVLDMILGRREEPQCG